MAEVGNYRLLGGQVAGDISSLTAVLAGIPGKVLCLHQVDMSAGGALNVLIQDEDAKTILGPFYMAANDRHTTVEFHAGVFRASVGKGISVKGSASSACTVVIVVFVL